MLCPFCDQELSLFSVYHIKKPVHLCEMCGIMFKLEDSNKHAKGGTQDVFNGHNNYFNSLDLWPIGSVHA